MKTALMVVMMAIGAMAQEPYSVKQDQLGETLATWQSHNKSDRCSKPGQSGWGSLLPGEDTCTWVFAGKKNDDTTYANATLFRRHAYFYQGQLYRVEMEFNRYDGASVLLAMTDKFGPAASFGIETYQNRLGLTFDRGVVSWSNGTSTVVYNEYDYNLRRRSSPSRWMVYRRKSAT